MNEAQLIIDVWEVVRDHIRHDKRPTVAQDMLGAFYDNGFTASDCAAIVDEDPDLANAFDRVFEDEDDGDEDIEDEL